jgi:hypothetical protein
MRNPWLWLSLGWAVAATGIVLTLTHVPFPGGCTR